MNYPRHGHIRLHAFVEQGSGKEHLALTPGDVSGDQPVLARVHSECLPGDALFSQRCDRGAQLETVLRRIDCAGSLRCTTAGAPPMLRPLSRDSLLLPVLPLCTLLSVFDSCLPPLLNFTKRLHTLYSTGLTKESACRILRIGTPFPSFNP